MIPEGVSLNQVDVWFQDEARIGQQGTLTRVWVPKGMRFRLKRQQQFLNAYLFGAVCPQKGIGAALVLPHANTAAMKEHLNEIAFHVPPERHAVVILDQARWHTTQHLHIPANLSLLPLPAYSPELNPQEDVWQVLRHDAFANRCFDSVDQIVDVACEAWRNFIALPEKIKSLCSREWAII